MKRTFDKKKIINTLFGIAVFILAANLVFGKFLKEDISSDKNELSSSKIELQFKGALFNLGLKEDLIQRQKGNGSQVKFTVQIPKDLPIVLILQEMNYVFNSAEVEIKSVESKIGGKTSVDLISGNKMKLNALLNYDTKANRKKVRVGFLITRFDEEYETDSLLLDFPEYFAVVLIPSKSSAEFVEKIIKKRKEYVVSLDDNIEELEYKLSNDYSVPRLKNSIREIVGSFSRAVFFLVDTQSELYKSKVYSLLKKEFEKRKIKLIEGNNFKSISHGEPDTSYRLFSEVLDNMNSGSDTVLLVSAKDFLSLSSAIEKYRKLGYRFTNPSALLF